MIQISKPIIDKENSKPWAECPECKGETVLYIWPHVYAGIWECQNLLCGASGNCEHTVVNDEKLDDDSHASVCEQCNQVIEDK